jgi:YggT family protein
MILFFIQIVKVATNVFSILIIANVFLSYILTPYHPIRRTVDQIVEPLLNPIRRIVPSIGVFDFSPIVLILLIQVLETLILSLLYAIG